MSALSIAAAVIIWVSMPAVSAAATVAVAAYNSKGKAVSNAVIDVLPAGHASARAMPGEAEIDQKDKEFIPHVTPVGVGTKVYFPNSDNIRHHVYSFSEAKTFEIPLYQGTPADPIVFDKPGVVVLGCNIHDWMSAYVFVTDTPYFSVTGDDGAARINDLPAGSYTVTVWHPRIKGEANPAEHHVTLSQDDSVDLTFEIEEKQQWKARRVSPGIRGGYR
ncbi:MAG: hypothetical protein WBN51_09480 [Gammaproteobacteria bacterium]